MPHSQSSDADNYVDVSSANMLDNKPVYQENQTPPPTRGSKTTEQIRLEQARMVDLLCVLLIVTLVTASVVTFCVTKSMFSFGFLSFLSLLPSVRRRKEEAIFPISAEDLQIKLKELDVEIERIRKQNASAILPLFTWLKRIIGR